MVRERMLEAAFFEFSENGYYSTTIDTITKRTGVNRIVFYAYFKNKNDILIHLFEELRSELSGFLHDKRGQKIWLNSVNVKEFEQPLIYISEVISNSSGLIRALIQGMLMDKKLFKLFTVFFAQFSLVFEPKIKSLQNSGRLHGCDSKSISQIMAITLLMSIFSHTIGAFQCSPKELAKQISIFFFSFLNMDEKAVQSTDNCEPKSEKIRKTRRGILDVARHEFASNGYSSVSMTSIAKKVGCSRSTLYLHFKKKADIKEALGLEISNVYNSLIQGPFAAEQGGDYSKIKDPDSLVEPTVRSKKSGLSNKSIETRRLILDAAKKMFSKNGYFETTIESITRKTPCSRSTFYQHFNGKDEIIQEIFDEMFVLFHPSGPLGDSIIYNTNVKNIESLTGMNSLVIDIFEKYSMVYWTLLQGSFYSEELGQNFIDIYNKIDRPLIRKINDLKADGKCQGVNPEIASRIIQTSLAYSSWMYNDGVIQCSKNELALSMAKFLFCFFNFMHDESNN